MKSKERIYEIEICPMCKDQILFCYCVECQKDTTTIEVKEVEKK